MRIALISPIALGADGNPGWFMITQGIRNLVRRAVPAATFMYVDMIDDNPIHWGAAATCHAAILCGNPRFTLSAPSWWEGPIWHRLLQLQASGITVIDGWSGAAYAVGTTRSLDEMAEDIMALPRNQEFIRYAGAIAGRITRDPLMQRIYEMQGIESVQLPCSSYWVAQGGEAERTRNAIVLGPLPRLAALAGAIRNAAMSLSPVDIIAATWNDYLWARNVGLDAQLVCDTESLLQLYQGYANVLTFRLHCAIPAAAMGAAVHLVAIDTRAMACEAFGIPVTPMPEFYDAPEQFVVGRPNKSEHHIVTILRGMLHDSATGSEAHADQLEFAFA